MNNDKSVVNMRDFFEYFKIKCPKNFRHKFDNNRKCKICNMISMSDWRLTDEGRLYYHTYSATFERNEIKKKITNILNKVSDENFKNQSEQLIKIVLENVHNSIQLHETAKQILYKSVLEPKYIKIYALICKKLSHLNIKGNISLNELKIQNNTSKKSKNTKRQLYKKHSFLRELLDISMEEYFKILKKSYSEEITYTEKKKIINIMHLIGELYMQNIIYSNIIHNIIQSILFSNNCDLELELLCKLISTAGKKLDNPSYKIHINKYFKEMNKIISYKKGRIKYLMMDVLDLRKSNWVIKSN